MVSTVLLHLVRDDLLDPVSVFLHVEKEVDHGQVPLGSVALKAVWVEPSIRVVAVRNSSSELSWGDLGMYETAAAASAAPGHVVISSEPLWSKPLLPQWDDALVRIAIVTVVCGEVVLRVIVVLVNRPPARVVLQTAAVVDLRKRGNRQALMDGHLMQLTKPVSPTLYFDTVK